MAEQKNQEIEICFRTLNRLDLDLSLFRFISVIAPFSVALRLLTECLKQAKSFKVNKILNAEEKKMTSTIAT